MAWTQCEWIDVSEDISNGVLRMLARQSGAVMEHGPGCQADAGIRRRFAQPIEPIRRGNRGNLRTQAFRKLFQSERNEQMSGFRKIDFCCSVVRKQELAAVVQSADMYPCHTE